VREYSSPLTLALPSTGNLTDDVVRNGQDHPGVPCFTRRSASGWSDVTAAQFLEQVRGVAKGLMASGVEEGARVALLSRTRYEWTLLDYAVWYAGAVTVPIFETSSAEQIEWILTDSGADVVVVETPAHAQRVAQAGTRQHPDSEVLVIEDGAVSDLLERGRRVGDEELEARRLSRTPASTATIVYTSGTTGRPKGCVLTHGNFMFELSVAVDELHELFDEEDAATLLFLPLAHVFARIIQIGAVKARVRLGHSADVKHLLADLESFRPTFILGVPRVFEKVFNTASQRAAADGRGRIFDRAADTAIAFSRALDTARGPGPVLRARHAVFDRMVYRTLREKLGGRCRYAISGGAPLGERLGHFYRGIGLGVLEGYGLTETAAAVTVNRPDLTKIGTVGRPLPGTTIRVADDGEVLVRGGQVFAGYWNDPEATREVLSPEGWVHTGDLGEIDDEGFLRVTGRKKEIIVTAGGKNVAPTQLEDRIRAHPLVSQCMVVGDGEPFIAALVTIDTEAFSLWADQHGKSGDVADLTEDPDLTAAVQSAVDDANRSVSQAESIRKFRILPDDWTDESGHLTPSLKLRRSVVLRDCGQDVDALYGRA
jgi:long-chain acyl-CoA synthetase